MQIQLTQIEIEIAVRQYIKSLGVSRPVGEINFVATRGSSGITAEIQMDQISFDNHSGVPAASGNKAAPTHGGSAEIEPDQEPETVETTTPKAKTTRASRALFKADEPAANTETVQETQPETVAAEQEPADVTEADVDDVLPPSTVAKKKLFG